MHSAETLANLQQFLTLLDPSLNLSEMLTNVARQLVDMFDVDHSGMLLFKLGDETGEVIAEHPSQGAVGLHVPLTDYPLVDQLSVQQKPIAVYDAQNDPQMGSARPTMRQLGIKSILIIPLAVRGNILGSLSLDAISRPREFTPAELELCHIIGNQIAVAVDYTFSLEMVETGRQRAQTLREISGVLSQSLDLNEVLHLILEQLEHVLPVSGSSIYLRADDGIQLMAWRGMRKPMANYDIIPLERLWGASEIFSKKQALLIRSTREHPRWTTSHDSAIESWLGVPLIVRGEVVGILNIDGYKTHQFKESHIPIATDFARQAAIAIHNAELYGEVTRRAELLSSIHEVGVSIVSSLELEEVLRTVSISILDVLDAQHVRIFLYNATTDSFTLASALDYGGKFRVLAANPNPPRKDGLTATVARSGKSLVIANSRLHPLFRGLAQFNYFGAIVGTPLKKREEVLGVINVAFRQPHQFTSHELDALQLLSLQAAVALDNARLYALEVKQIEQELTIARRIQQGFLPRRSPEIPGWSISAICLPARETGGDFYEFVRRRDNYWGLAIGDVSGKSIQAAMLMSVAQSLVAAKGSDHYSPGRVMAETNRLLYDDMPSNAFVAVSYILISEDNNIITFSNGGQLAPFLVPAGNKPIRLLETPGAHWPLGVLADVEYEELSLSLQGGDMVVFFTDGLIERMNPKRQMLGFDGVGAALEHVRGRPTNRALEHLLEVAENFAMGAGAHDDITLLLIQRLK